MCGVLPRPPRSVAEAGVKFLWTVLVKLECIENVCADSSLTYKCLTETWPQPLNPSPLEHLVLKKPLGLFDKSGFSFRGNREAGTKLGLGRTEPGKILRRGLFLT